MGFWSSVGNINASAFSQNSTHSYLAEDSLKKLQRHYNTSKQDKDLFPILTAFIVQAYKTNKSLTSSQLTNTIIATYTTSGKVYPDNFDVDKALLFLKNPEEEKIAGSNKSTTQTNPLHWYKQKSEEVENHLKHIALMKLQLTKNLKDLQSQNGGHLWIDTDFIEPATETLQASIEQVQDLEDRLYLLNLSYQDHL